jgi:uroporphyrinogen III methyltransferase/synthase
MRRRGKVYLTGAGPGDPELLTLKARRVLESADVVVYDNLASTELLHLAPPKCERIYAGKKRASRVMEQHEIDALLIEHARAGKTVVRLKGGDPFLFGRGGEEAEALADAGVDFEVIPGVTSPVGIAAYTGVPLTHREHSSMVTIVTGHDPDAIDWGATYQAETLVILMGLTTAHAVVERLIAAGRPPQTPALAVRWGTRPDQEAVQTTLEDLPAALVRARLKPPATIIVGDVVALRPKLSWFERLPLFGKRVVVTRAAEQAGALSARLRELGAMAIEYPTIEIAPASDYGPLDEAIARLDTYDWLLFTSVNGVRFFFDRLDRSPFDLRRLRARICAIGPATRGAIEQAHLKVDLMPERYVAESLVEAFAGIELRDARILLPRAAVARDLIPDEFRRRGAFEEVVEAYRTILPASPCLLPKEIDWILFTSSSTVRNFVEMAGREAWNGARIASIGAVTSATVREYGGKVDLEADPHTIDGLVEGLAAHIFAPAVTRRDV